MELEQELQLYHYTVANLQEAVFWVNAAGNIIQVNDMAARLSGYTIEELTRMHVTDLNPSPIVANFPQFWQRLKKEKKITFEAQHRHKTGYLYDVEITGNFITYNGQEFSCSIVRDISKKKTEERLLQTISEATSNITGKDFLVELCRNFTRALNMQFALIAECIQEGSTQVRTLCLVNHDTVIDNIEYDTKGRPCEVILQGDGFFMGKEVYKHFPASEGIEAATGVPIYSSVSGKPIGHIIISNPSPVSEQKNQLPVLKIFAARVGAEIERMQADKALQHKNEELRLRLNEIELYHTTLKNLRDQVYWLNKSGAFIRVNEAAANETGYNKDELSKMTVFNLNPGLTEKEWNANWTETKQCGQQILETEHRSKDGNLYPVEVTNNFIEHDGVEYFCSTVRDIRKRRLEEELLRTISERTAGVTGEDYFRELARFVTSTLNVRYSMVVECSNGNNTRLRMLSYVERQEVRENIEYDSTGTPCEIVMQGKDFFCARGLERTFPREKGIQSWVAVPIHSPSTGKVIGNIAAFDKMPMSKEQNQTAILKIFAARAGAEIERIEAQKNLEKANEELAKRLQEIEELKNQLAAENKYLQEEIRFNNNFDDIVTKSRNFQKILQQIEQVATTDATVLIIGESGTGKELLARAVHNISNRSKRPLIKVNCATLPANLIESELFGHERGAFTGAMEKRIGRFELADGGTIFLDEIGELPVELQAKLLRVLQEGEFERLGNPKTLKVNVRVIAATNRNLEQAIEKKEFREDLFYRLNVFPIVSPPLRDRKEDIPLLVKHFCQKYEAKVGKKITNIPGKVIDALMAYNWPGNIRELENIIERALILSRGNTLEYGEWVPAPKTLNKEQPAAQKLEDLEKEHIIAVLNKTGWKVSGEKGAAKILGLNPTTLEARMKKLGIERKK
ncbi:sigma 54-interacting transcriptional regulator [Niastella caeni]|nr:sigma 54-interacting transcriptional regulator [Niastella caeni]